MITPEPEPAMPGKETCVPATALSANGAEPEVGQEVEYTAKARITRIEGGHVYLEPTHVNGEAVVAPARSAPDEDDVMRAALAADEEGMG